MTKVPSKEDMKVIIDEWIEKGLRTGETDWENAEKAIREIYELAELDPTIPIFRVPSPKTGALAALGTRAILDRFVSKKIDREEFRNCMINVCDRIGEKAGAIVFEAVRTVLGDKHIDGVDWESPASEEVRVDLKWHEWYGGQFWAYWATYTDVMIRLVGWKPGTDKIRRAERAYRLLVESSCYMWPNRRFSMICARPLEIHINSEKKLHRDGGMAISWPDGWGLYMLNGVRVSKELAVTPAEALDPRLFASITNVEERREFIRKVGVERLVQKIGAKVLDKNGDYELLMVNLGGRTGERPFLKMRNPSIGTWHIEGVPPECKTVIEAITKSRNKADTLPRTLT